MSGVSTACWTLDAAANRFLMALVAWPLYKCFPETYATATRSYSNSAEQVRSVKKGDISLSIFHMSLENDMENLCRGSPWTRPPISPRRIMPQKYQVAHGAPPQVAIK